MARSKRDPLIAAMIAKLPDGEEWPVDRQLAWLHLMAMAFGTVYGGDAAAHFGAKPPAPQAFKPVVKAKPQFQFYIDEQGRARKQDGTPIKASDVKGDIVDLRGMDGDVKTIRWADGTTGLNGADLTIVAA
jgi:hypothetical protein